MAARPCHMELDVATTWSREELVAAAGKSMSRLSHGQIRRLRPSSGHIVVTAASPPGSTVITVADPTYPVVVATALASPVDVATDPVTAVAPAADLSTPIVAAADPASPIDAAAGSNPELAAERQR
ncbi:Os12g0226832 [Oryza sativa Japonica Group]|uniref:Os12g0226832 protein n=1 Tax=Oryza sativa subsp. japonica TaxID=39947 RepID=Q2QVJ7_ORYSJ|nr:hypothetical protein LOC_Os12g12570 [Oryza sativa Japonica Group]BAT16405.1 Os12g0226832 [Oryza sativa Japonica Group]